ncbi:MAG TPA: glutaredoxin family protein [Candidatus Saccharimonadales bacterium]|jgi:glutaredoxin 3|nr:glutaredoxin family protein [Candidatus Saccharimonadales bacterium]
MSKTVTIYTTNTCAYCEMVKKFLNGKGVGYTVVNMDEEPTEVRQKVIEMSGAMTVPIVVVADEADETAPKNITVGWNPAKLAAAVQGLAA